MSNDYYSFKTEQFTCKHCGWVGLGSATNQGDLFEELFEINCPTCGEKVGIINLPTLDEALENGSKKDKKRVLERLEFLKRYEDSKLKDINLLPEIEGTNIAFQIEEFDENGQGYLAIKYGDKVIWTEMLAYEYYERFIEIAKLLKEKYGDKMIDLLPPVNGTYLYGDKLSSLDLVDKFRKAIPYWKKKNPRREK